MLLEYAGCAIPGLFALTWGGALIISKLFRIEERWSSALAAGSGQAG